MWLWSLVLQSQKIARLLHVFQARKHRDLKQSIYLLFIGSSPLWESAECMEARKHLRELCLARSTRWYSISVCWAGNRRKENALHHSHTWHHLAITFYTHTHMRMYTHTHKLIYTCAHANAHTHAYIHTGAHTYRSTHTQTQPHTNTNMHTRHRYIRHPLCAANIRTNKEWTRCRTFNQPLPPPQPCSLTRPIRSQEEAESSGGDMLF